MAFLEGARSDSGTRTTSRVPGEARIDAREGTAGLHAGRWNCLRLVANVDRPAITCSARENDRCSSAEPADDGRAPARIGERLRGAMATIPDISTL